MKLKGLHFADVAEIQEAVTVELKNVQKEEFSAALRKMYNRAKACIYRVSQEECAKLREGVPYVKLYRYNPKHLCTKLNGYGDRGQRKVWSSCGSTSCTCQLTILSISVPECGVVFREWSLF